MKTATHPRRDRERAGRWLRRFREQLGLHPDEIGLELGIHGRTWLRYERAESRLPDGLLEQLERLAAAYSILLPPLPAGLRRTD